MWLCVLVWCTVVFRPEGTTGHGTRPDRDTCAVGGLGSSASSAHAHPHPLPCTPQVCSDGNSAYRPNALAWAAIVVLAVVVDEADASVAVVVS